MFCVDLYSRWICEAKKSTKSQDFISKIQIKLVFHFYIQKEEGEKKLVWDFIAN